MKSVTATVYTLEELQEQFPDSYEKVVERWRERAASDPCLPWRDETMDSFKAVIHACDGELTDWQIGPHYPSHCSVSCEDLSGKRAAVRMWRNVLAPNGYKRNGWNVEFPGNCPFTGYCADEQMLQIVWNELVAGESLKDALECLASVAQQCMENDLEQWMDEESMWANWEDLSFYENGNEVPHYILDMNRNHEDAHSRDGRQFG